MLDYPSRSTHYPIAGEVRRNGVTVYTYACYCGWEYICGPGDERDWWLGWYGRDAFRDHFGQMAASGSLGPGSWIAFPKGLA